MTNEEKAQLLLDFAETLEGDGFTYFLACGCVEKNEHEGVYGIHGYTEHLITLMKELVIHDELAREVLSASLPFGAICSN